MNEPTPNGHARCRFCGHTDAPTHQKSPMAAAVYLPHNVPGSHLEAPAAVCFKSKSQLVWTGDKR